LNNSLYVLDKSFLQGVKRQRIRELVQTQKLLLSDDTFYELMTCEAAVRISCFQKLTCDPNPVGLVSHIGTLVRKEIETHLPSGTPFENRWDKPFRFNKLLLQEDYALPEEDAAFVGDQAEELSRAVREILDRAATTSLMFPGLLTGSDDERRTSREQGLSEFLCTKRVESYPRCARKLLA
jgi:hypothetical protein